MLCGGLNGKEIQTREYIYIYIYIEREREREREMIYLTIQQKITHVVKNYTPIKIK